MEREKAKVAKLSKQDRRTLGVKDPAAGLIDPRRNRFVPYWDIVMLSALAFTAIVTPVEVALFDDGSCLTVLWMLNRVVDLLFTIDIMLIFNTAFQEDGVSEKWVYSRRRIACRYINGWLIIDVISVLPFWLAAFFLLGEPSNGYIGCWLDPTGGANAVSANAVIDFASGGVADRDAELLVKGVSTIKTIKLVRLLKLARIFKASRVLKRLVADLFQSKLEMTFGTIKLLQLFCTIILVTHWQACMWAGVSNSMRDDTGQVTTWIDAYIQKEIDQGHTGDVRWTDLYTTALYWSVMTLTSIGYGDVIPMNTVERALCSLYMIISGVSWTYVLGTAAGIASTLDPNAVMYQTTMDQLNYFMRKRQLPREMRHQLRDYFTSARTVHQVSGDAELLSKMSPLLQGTVACCANKPWLDQVWFLRNLDTTREERDFVAALSMQLRVQAFVRDERLPLGQLYVLRKGMVVRLWRFHGANSVWGEDMLLESRALMCHAQAVAMTYCEAFTLDREQFLDVGQLHPGPMALVRRRMRRVMGMRIIIKHVCASQGMPSRSFVSEKDAEGYTFVQDSLPPTEIDRRFERVLMTHTAKLVGQQPAAPGEAAPAAAANTDAPAAADASLVAGSAPAVAAAAAPAAASPGVAMATSADVGRLADGQRKMEARFNARMNEMADALLNMEVLLQRVAQGGPPTTPARQSPRGPRARPAAVDESPIGYGINDA